MRPFSSTEYEYLPLNEDTATSRFLLTLLGGKGPFPNSPLFPTLEMKFTEIPLKVKQKLGYFSFGERINLTVSPPKPFVNSDPRLCS
jgi:hypothetical protein